MDEAIQIARHTGRAAGKATNCMIEKAEKEHVFEKLNGQKDAVAKKVGRKYLESTGHRIETDAKIAAIGGTAYIAVLAAGIAPTIAFGGAVGIAAYEVVSESELTQKAKATYEKRLGRDLGDDKNAVASGAKTAISVGKTVGKAVIDGYKETRESGMSPKPIQ